MKKKLKILIVSQYFWPENFRINELVNELSELGHSVSVLTGKPNYPRGKLFPEYIDSPNNFLSYGGIPITRVPMLPRSSGGIRLILNYVTFFFSASIIGVYKLRKQKFDVIFVFEPSPITVGIPALVLKKIKKVPIVFWVLDLWPETLSAVGVVKSKPVLAIIGRLVSFIYNHSDLVLGQSKGFEKGINKYCKDKTKFRYFPNWSETVFEQSSKETAPEIEKNNHYFNIIFTGNIGESQDFSSILDAAERLPSDIGVRWYIIGDGRLTSWVEAEIIRRSLQNRFFLLGRYPLKRMPSFFNSASALLVSLKPDPVFSLTIPGKVQSYMAAGKPILAMLDGEGNNLIREAKAGLTCPAGNSEQLVKNIKMMLSIDKKELLLFGKNGKNYAEKEFSKKQLISRLEEWFHEVSS